MRELGNTYTKQEREHLANFVQGKAGFASKDKARAKQAKLLGR